MLRGLATTANSFCAIFRQARLSTHRDSLVGISSGSIWQPAPGIPGLPVTLSSGQQMSMFESRCGGSSGVGRVLDRMGDR